MPITLDGTLGITTPALTVTGASTYTGDISTAGNLIFTTTGDRIIGDLSTTTFANRLAFQSSTTNGATQVTAIPNGTGTTASFVGFNNSDPTNSSFGFFGVLSAEVRITSGIAGTGTYYPLTFYTGGSERMRIDTSGNVGIATTTPSSFGKFAVQGASTNRAFYADSLAQPVARYDDNSFVINGLTIRNTGITGSNQGIGLLFQLGASGTAVNAGAIQMRSEGDFSTGATQDAAMTFATCLDGTSTERMRIDSSGRVGIGTSSPSTTLDVAASVGTIRVSSTTTTATTYFTAVNAVGNFYIGRDSSTGGNFGTAYAAVLFSEGAYPMVFYTTSLERMRIDSSGNVGIGTSSPSSYGKLGVVSGVSYFGVASDTYTSAKFGPRPANDGVVTVLHEYGGNGSGGYWKTDANSSTFSIYRIGTIVSYWDSSSNFYMNSGYGSAATAYGCRAWVNFNGTGTVAIRGSGNVSSITDNGTGDYTVNFTTAMPDANYATLFTPGGQETTSTANFDMPRRSTTPTTSAVRVLYSNGNQDTLYGSVAIFR